MKRVLCSVVAGLFMAVYPSWGADLVPGADVSVLLSTGLECERRNDWRKALESYIKARLQDPWNESVLAAFERVAKRIARESEADRRRRRGDILRSARQSIERRQVRRQGLFHRLRHGREVLRQGWIFEAHDIFRRVWEEDPDFEPARKETFRVVRMLQRRLKRHRFPSAMHVSAAEGLCAYHREDWSAAAVSLEDFSRSEVVPEDLQAGRLGEYAVSAQQRRDRTRRQKEREQIFRQAVMDYEKGRAREAEQGFRALLARDPADTEARRYLELMARLSDELREEFRRTENDREIGERMTRGTLFYIQEKYPEALEEFFRVLEMDPKNEEAREQLREVERSLKSTGVRLPDTLVVDDTETKFREGLRLYGNGRLQEAQSVFQEVLRLDPSNQEALTALERVKDHIPSGPGPE
ncbi:MAG TPA: hypothetical protein PK876_00035 [Elusimicrobiota bacterium]|nr:hypothetical protein [Elusimicrobiota bacterium]